MRHSAICLPLLASAFLTAFAVTFAARAVEPTAPPSTANGCGRLQRVTMIPIPSTHRIGGYPSEALRRGQSGHVYMRLLVDKYGFARRPEVVVSSGYAILDQAAIDAIKDRWRWEPPPPECQESGVILGAAYNWSIGTPEPSPIYLDDPRYPAEARARKQGGSGKAEFTFSGENKNTDVRITSSTGSPELDAAAIDMIKGDRYVVSGTASAGLTTSQSFEFVPRNDPISFAALMGPAIIPPPAELAGKSSHWSRIYSRTPPSHANDCGRNETVFLEPSLTNSDSAYPVEAAATGKEGRVLLDVLVDKGGTASDVTVRQSSGSPILDKAAVQAVKGVWHWDAPPPECAESGVHLRVPFEWFLASGSRARYMPGDLDYPTDATAIKQNASGTVAVSRSSDGDLVFVKVVTSTNSPALDAAMIKIATDDFRFTPGTKGMRKPSMITTHIDFVGDVGTMLATAAAPLKRIAPLAPPPGAANDCGRSAIAYLAPIDTSHVLVPIPMVAVKPKNRWETPPVFRAQGALRMQVLVDKNGNAANVTVAESSAPPEMERAVTGTVKENYRWDPPPPECAERGVALTVNYVYTWAAPQLQIYADDPGYPEAARQRSMGAAAVIQLRSHRDEIEASQILISSGSPELDERMIKIVTDRVLADIKANPQSAAESRFDAKAYPVMLMPSYVASPQQLAARAQTTPAP